MKISVFGMGYVGLSNAVMFAKSFTTFGIDIDIAKVNLLKKFRSPIKDIEIESALSNQKLDINFSLGEQEEVYHSDIIVVATPTNFDEETEQFNTGSLESIFSKLESKASRSVVVVKSTVPIGFTERMSQTFPTLKLVFCPEFLREGSALSDSLRPSRIIIGGCGSSAETVAAVFSKCVENAPPVIHMRPSEAEAVKLFANTYLAMRVAFFNELDSFALSNGFNAKNIISGVGGDERIGSHYNNPSFGYGGCCLPKDTKQLLSNFNSVPQAVMKAIVDSNAIRKDFLVSEILKSNPKCIGVYRLVMKTGSDNFRESSIISIAETLSNKGIKILIYEPTLSNISFLSFGIQTDKDTLLQESDIIICNRIPNDLKSVKQKIFTRDIFGNN